MVAFGFFFLCFFLCHDASNYLDRCIEGLVIGVHGNLGQYRADRFINAALNQFGADAVLKVVSHISLAHGRAHGHGRLAVSIMLFAEFIHGSVDHAYLGSVAVYDGYLPAFLDKVRNDLCGPGHGSLLLRKIGSQIFVANGQYNAFFCHNPYLACL